MGNGLTETQLKLFNMLVVLLIAIVTIITGANFMDISLIKKQVGEMPDKYVRLERYTSDRTISAANQLRIENSLSQINTKIDRLIEQKTTGQIREH